MGRGCLNRLGALFAVALIAATISDGAGAATFSAQRGINLDIWTSWQSRDKWGDRSVMLPFPEWRQHISDAELAQLKADGFDFVRMPVDPAPLMAAEGSALRIDLISSVIESARRLNEAGLKVVVDLHLHGEGKDIGAMGSVMATVSQFDRYLDLVRKIGSQLSSEDPTMIAFELMNEPIIDCEDSQDKWPKRLKQLFAAGRSSAPDLTLILSGACYGGADRLAAVDPSVVADDNVMWSFHSYEPFLLTHQGSSWAGDVVPYVTGIPYPPDSVPRSELDAALEAIRERMRNEAPAHRVGGLLPYLDEQIALVDTEEKLHAVMERPFKVVSEWASQNGIDPGNILLGEFGMMSQDYGKPYILPPAWRAAHASDMIELAEFHGFAWAIWGYGGSFGIVDSFEGKKASPDVLDAIKALPPQLRTTLGN